MLNPKVNYELVEIRKKFEDYYRRTLRFHYKRLEPARRKYLIIFSLWVLLFTALAGIFIYFCVIGEIPRKDYFSREFFKFYIFYIAIACGVCSIPVSSFKKRTKLAVMDKILDFWGEFNYSTEKALINKDYIKKSALFCKFDNQEQDDAFRGQYHGAEIKVSEQTLTQIAGSGRHRREDTIFKGVLIALQLNKKCGGNTVVYGRSGLKTFLYYAWFKIIILLTAIVPIGIICWFVGPVFDREHIWYSLCFLVVLAFLFVMFFFVIKSMFLQNKEVQVKKVLLEDVVFSKKWKVYAGDQVEARYVLTPALMERMLAVKKLFHGNRLDFSFFGNNLLIAVHTAKDMFETTSLFKTALDYRKVQEVICQLYSVFSVIDVLRLQKESERK